MEHVTERRLAAILAADVVGYSRLMGDDHEATLEALTESRELFASRIQHHRGRIVNAPGDSILAEFASVVDAVACAVEIQRELAEKNSVLSEERRMIFRIGVNLGDVLVKDEAIYGDGVNIAARLEAMAEAGGICISRPAYDQVKGRLPLEYEYLGEQQVKNIAEPVRAYSVLTRPGAAAHRVVAARSAGFRSGRAVGLVASVLVVAAAAFGGFYFFGPFGSPDPDRGSAVADPDRPSIAVLPFNNVSGDPEQEYFSDGISETIITDLSKLRGLTVIARNSSFVYKGQNVDLRDVSRDLGVKYILEGSVQKAGDRVRINAQLIDGATGDHLWAGRWDRDLRDIFALQDEITQRIVAELDVALVEGDQARVWRRSTTSPEAYEQFLRAESGIKPRKKADNDRNRRYMEQALELDPDFAMAWVRLGWTYDTAAFSGWTDSRMGAWDLAIEMANKALEIDPELGEAYALLTEVMMFKENQAHAMDYARRAVALSPSGADIQAVIAIHKCWAGDRTGLDNAVRAMELNPHPPDWYYNPLGICYRVNEKYEEAVAALRKCVELVPDYIFCHANLALSHLALGEEQIARQSIKEVLRINPNFRSDLYIKGPIDPADKRRYQQQLQSLGLP